MLPTCCCLTITIRRPDYSSQMGSFLLVRLARTIWSHMVGDVCLFIRRGWVRCACATRKHINTSHDREVGFFFKRKASALVIRGKGLKGKQMLRSRLPKRPVKTLMLGGGVVLSYRMGRLRALMDGRDAGVGCTCVFN